MSGGESGMSEPVRLEGEDVLRYGPSVLAELRQWFQYFFPRRQSESSPAPQSSGSNDTTTKSGSAESERERLGILLIGAGGVGKSTLMQVLDPNQTEFEVTAGTYTESKNVEIIDIPAAESPTGRTIGIIAPPGQEHRRGGTWDKLKAAMARGEFRGIMLVSTFGYHSIDEVGPGLLKEFRAHPTDIAAGLAEYLRNRRKDEIAIFREILPHLAACPTPLWMLSIVSKQDLWWRQLQEVEEFYRRGEYSKLVDEIARTRSATGFRHEFVFTSFVICNFRTSRGESLAENCSGYDAVEQKRTLARLRDAFAAVHEWEREAGVA